MKKKNSHGWKKILNDYPLNTHYKDTQIHAYSEFMPSPKVGISPYGDIDYSIFDEKDIYGWTISEMEEEIELKPGIEHVGKIRT